MRKINVLVVDDSLTVRKYLMSVLSGDPEFEVVGEAADGRQACELCQTLHPDVVSLDMMLPVMTGQAATEYIMAYCPTPILIVSASINRGELFKTYEALSAGAVDVLEKPREAEPDLQWEQAYRQAIRMAARIKVIMHPRARLAARTTQRTAAQLPPGNRAYACVAIGASTGGPGAVVRLLRKLPADFPLPILLVIHISPPFGAAMTEWLDNVLPLPVRHAADGQPMPRVGQPQVIMPPPDRHLVVRDGRLWTTADPERHHCRPSVDVLFESLARESGASAVACLLTGMGTDGAQGLLEVRQAGGLTIAQDEATSVVFGMPREAARLDAAQHILALDDVAAMLLDLVARAKAQGAMRSYL